MRREEGPPPISLALLPPTEAAAPLVFGHRPRLTPQALIKLAPAVERAGGTARLGAVTGVHRAAPELPGGPGGLRGRARGPAPRGARWGGRGAAALEIVGGFMAVDGATVITRGYELAFGAKVTRAAASTPVEQLIVTEPVLGSTAVRTRPAQHGGTRHLAAA